MNAARDEEWVRTLVDRLVTAGGAAPLGLTLGASTDDYASRYPGDRFRETPAEGVTVSGYLRPRHGRLDGVDVFIETSDEQPARLVVETLGQRLRTAGAAEQFSATPGHQWRLAAGGDFGVRALHREDPLTRRHTVEVRFERLKEAM